MQHIQGEERNQLQIFCLEQMVASDSFVRVIDFFVDSIDLASFGFKHVTFKEEGRPPYHPAVLLKLYFYGYRYGIRSSRKLEREAAFNLEVRWLLCEQTPSARTICSFRKEYAEAFRNIFRKFVFLLKELGLVEGKTIAIDSFKVRAQNSLKNNYNQKKIDRQMEYIDGRIKEFEDALDVADSQEVKANLQQKIETQKKRKAKYQAIEQELKETGKDQPSCVRALADEHIHDPARASVILSLFTQAGRCRIRVIASPQSPTSFTSGPGRRTTVARFFPNAMAIVCPSSAYVG